MTGRSRVKALSILVLLIPALLAGCASKGRAKTEEIGGIQSNSDADIYAEMAVEYMRNGRYDIALQKVEKGLTVDKRYAPLHAVAGTAYGRVGDKAKAEEHFSRALSISPTDPYVLNAHATYLCDTRQFAKADAAYRKALSNPLYSTPYVALFNAGSCAERAGNRGKAEQYYRQALGRNVNHPDSLLKLAGIEYDRGNTKVAQAFMAKYSKVGQPTPAALLLAVRIERKLGNHKVAKALENSLRQRYPGAPQIKEL